MVFLAGLPVSTGAEEPGAGGDAASSAEVVATVNGEQILSQDLELSLIHI